MRLARLILLSYLPLTVAAAAPVDKPQAPLVFVLQAKTDDLFDSLTYPARLVPLYTATLLSDADGIVKKISAPLGKSVKRNESIMVLGNIDPIYKFAPLVVRAPVAGVVSSVEVTEGSRVMKGQRLAVITDPSRVKISIEVAAGDLGAISSGLKGDLTIPGQDDDVEVKVLGISPFVDPATGTATVELAPTEPPDKNAPLKLPPGLIGRVSFRVREHKGIQLPEEAIVYRGQSPAVRIVKEGKARYSPVTLGQTRRGQVEVVKGIEPGTEVVVRASTFIADGEAVNVQKAEGPTKGT